MPSPDTASGREIRAGDDPCVQLGYLSHVAGDRAPRQVFRETIELAVTAEAHGFDTFWVAQHHGGHLEGLLPSPLVLLAAVAARTTTLRLGTAVVAAPLEDPRRLAEDAATLDALAGGRVELGIGAGADATAASAFGHDHDRRHEECTRTVDRLCALLHDDGAGGPVPLVPAAPGLRDRLWWATSSVAGVDAAAARGIGLVSGKPGMTAELERYWSRCTSSPRVAVSRTVAVGESPDAVVTRWAADPARSWATALVVQTQPARADLSDHVRTVVGLGAALRARERIPVRA
jgi:alkanesulfonate monooxygenase SsuD/methylene tetrahydromethanopterin reductase-like flavin-dependent oxidoreductase (luciferase family)